ncbi:hypothetical protein N7478_007154 [Penicillium angulare]|uniref:uncharacterized protein n=1 Tax=Penicillium angulare TaxID=116970 RepID=UPI00253FE946|nr:uncharacterized protein N7478_007154 [Penicillium angulare]KAJ5281782.1 hypothetical protein N7478_007154 [Penicillium angulare]
MGRSEPPFLYDRPNAYRFYGPTDPEFDPKAVTQASRTPASPRQRPNGPLVTFNRHPDTWETLNEKKPTWTPMSPRTKSWVKGVRATQLFVRSVTLLGALASLFCGIVVTKAGTTVIWIIRAGPIVAILHTLYAIYHLFRSPVTRPPASQASYGVFAGVLDAGLIPFYVFTAFMANRDYWDATGEYDWSTLIGGDEVALDIVEAMFICGIVNSGLHLVSFCLSIFLAIVFKKIAQLPPDMNPLEDNLTARPRRGFRKIDTDEKHMSSSTLHSNTEDPLMGSPRTLAFMHTRNESFGGETIRGSVDLSNEKPQPQIHVQHPHRLSHLEPASPDNYFDLNVDHEFDFASTDPTPEYRNVPARSPNIVEPETHTRQLASRTANRSDSVSPISNNWVAYPERDGSPISDVQSQTGQNNNNALRQSSSVYSRRTDKSATSTGSGIRDWFAYAPKNAPSIGSAIVEDTRGEYASLAAHEYYGNGEDKEQDLGDQQRFNVFPDPAEHDHDNDDGPADGLPFNPLMLNPPTPQPNLTETQENTDPVRRSPLGDNPNFSQNQKARGFVPHEDPDFSPSSKNVLHGDFDFEEDNPNLTIRDVNDQEDMKRKPSKLTKKRSKKLSAYQSLKKDDSDDEGYLSARVPSSPAIQERDRKGRVVSNSGADTARSGLVSGVGASLSSYGSYIAGLGVGRRRDVSGKVAEEGRGGKSVEVRPAASANPSPNQSPAGPARAAGWARFAGL